MRRRRTKPTTHLSVEVKDVEGKEQNLDLDVLNLDVLSLPPAELLERKELLLDGIPRDGLAVQDEVSSVARHALAAEIDKEISSTAHRKKG